MVIQVYTSEVFGERALLGPDESHGLSPCSPKSQRTHGKSRQRVHPKIIQDFNGMPKVIDCESCMQCFCFLRSHHNKEATWDKTVKHACG